MLQDFIMTEQNILLWIQETLRNDVLTPILIFITNLGNGGAVWIILSIGLLLPKRTRQIGLLSLCALGMAFIIDNVLLKNLIARTRPYEVIDGLDRLIAKQKDYSFPSGHTGSAFAAAVVMFLGLPKRYGFITLVLAVLMGFSRLYVGVHYLTDVLCGAVIGTLVAVLVYRIGMRLIQRKRRKEESML